MPNPIGSSLWLQDSSVPLRLGYDATHYTDAHVESDGRVWLDKGFGARVGAGALAQTGAYRLANDEGVVSRDQGNSADITLLKLNASDEVELGTHTRIKGNLYVEGTTFYVDSETLTIADNVVVLNSNVTGTPTEDGGIEIERGTETNAVLLWKEANDDWYAGLAGSEYKLWHAGNHGVGSGLNADLLDGNHASAFAAASHAHAASDITSGTLAVARGGTGLSTAAAGDIIYASATNTWAKLAKGADGKVLKLVSGAPSWQDDIGITAHNLAYHSDVTITDVVDGELLRYNGSAWINNTLAEANVASASALSSHTGDTGNPHGVTKTQVGLGSVENTALSTWGGSTNLITLGTVATGTWNATAIGATKGGTGLTSYAAGDIIYASATNTLAKLVKGTDGHVLTLVSGLPSWQATGGGTHTLDSHSNVTITDIASGEIIKWSGTAWVNNTLAEAGVSAVGHAHSAADITSGTLAIARGGTNATTYTTSQFLWYNGTTIVASGYSNTSFAAASHQHNASDINAGTLAIARGGTNSTTYTTSQFLWYNGTSIVASGYSNSSFATATHYHAAADVTSGTFDNARIAQSNVTQHQAALSIGASQVTTGTFGAGNYTFPADVTVNGALRMGASTINARFSSAVGDGTYHYTDHGYIRFGPLNTSYAHIYTDRDWFYTNKGIQIIGNTVLHAGNYNSYSPTLIGGGASGTWGISITGNAATATSATNADTVDSVHASSFLRSDTSDNLTSGTLTLDSGTGLTAAAGATVAFNNTTGTAPFTVASTTVVTNLNASLLEGNAASAFAAASHSHSAADITSGTLAIVRGGTNATSYTTSQFLWYNGSALVASGYSNSSFAASSHAHSAADITSGTLVVGRGGTGTTGFGTNAFVKADGSGNLADAVTAGITNADTGIVTNGDGIGTWTGTAPSTGSPGWTYGAIIQVYDGAQDLQLAFGGSSYGRLSVRRRDSGTFYTWTYFPSNSGTITTNDYAKYDSSGNLTGRSYSEVKSDLSLNLVENTALSTWAGTTSVITLGTVTTGTWSATAIAATKGGTGQTAYAAGDILYSSATNVLSRLTKGTNGHVLTLASGLPAWQAVSGSTHTLDSHSNVTITSIGAGEVLKWSGTAWINNTLAEAGIAAASHVHSAADITSGTLAIARGGTNQASFSSGYLVQYNGTSLADWIATSSVVQTSRSITVAGTANQITSSAGAQNLGADRTWTLSLPNDVTVTDRIRTGATTNNYDVTDGFVAQNAAGTTAPFFEAAWATQSHAYTTAYNANVYFAAQLLDSGGGSYGGAKLVGLGSLTGVAMQIAGYTGYVASTAFAGSARAITELVAGKVSGGSLTDPSANQIMFGFRIEKASPEAIALWDEDGDTWFKGSLQWGGGAAIASSDDVSTSSGISEELAMLWSLVL